jgi:hypothetical protein
MKKESEGCSMDADGLEPPVFPCVPFPPRILTALFSVKCVTRPRTGLSDEFGGKPLIVFFWLVLWKDVAKSSNTPQEENKISKRESFRKILSFYPKMEWSITEKNILQIV